MGGCVPRDEWWVGALGCAGSQDSADTPGGRHCCPLCSCEDGLTGRHTEGRAPCHTPKRSSTQISTSTACFLHTVPEPRLSPLHTHVRLRAVCHVGRFNCFSPWPQRRLWYRRPCTALNVSCCVFSLDLGLREGNSTLLSLSNVKQHSTYHKVILIYLAMYLCIYVSVYLCICVSVYLCICVYLSVSVCLCICVSTCLCVCVSINYLCVYLPLT